jgi:hypothetical protein
VSLRIKSPATRRNILRISRRNIPNSNPRANINHRLNISPSRSSLLPTSSSAG